MATGKVGLKYVQDKCCGCKFYGSDDVKDIGATCICETNKKVRTRFRMKRAIPCSEFKLKGKYVQ